MVGSAPGAGQTESAVLRTSRVPAGLEQFAGRKVAHATSKTDLVVLTHRRVREQSRDGFPPGRSRSTGHRRPDRARTPQAGQAQAAPDPAQMQRLLKDWERQSAKLKTLDVWIYRIDRPAAGMKRFIMKGGPSSRALSSPTSTSRRSRPSATPRGSWSRWRIPKDPKKRRTTPDETIICGANEVWQYLYPTKQIFVFPLAKEQRQRALDEGPLPFLFNMKAEEAQARYEMKLLGAESEILLGPGSIPSSRRTRKRSERPRSSWIRSSCCRSGSR